MGKTIPLRPTRRAEDTTARLQARADALDELLAPGGPAEVTSLASEDIQIQLDAVTTQAAVEEELAQIKDQLAAEASQPHAEPAHGRRAAAATSPPEQPGTTRS